MLLSESLYGLPSVISNESSVIVRLDTLNRESNKINRFLSTVHKEIRLLHRKIKNMRNNYKIKYKRDNKAR